MKRAPASGCLASPLDAPYQLKQNGAEFKLFDLDSRRFFIFDADGLLTSIFDQNGNTHTLTYSDRILDQVSNGNGGALDFSYGSKHDLVQVSDGAQMLLLTQQQTGERANLSSLTDQNGDTTSYFYDFTNFAQGLMTSRRLPEGNTPC